MRTLQGTERNRLGVLALVEEGLENRVQVVQLSRIGVGASHNAERELRKVTDTSVLTGVSS